MRLTDMKISERENYLRAIEFRNPLWIPCSMVLAPICWYTYREKLEEIVLRHPMIFGEYKKGSIDFDKFDPVYKKGYFRDNWGCLWYTPQDGLEGQVIESPLEDWKAFDKYKAPDFNKLEERSERDWGKIKSFINERKQKGLLTVGGGERLFDRLYFLRGFENLMIDIATDHPKLPLLIEMLLEYELGLVKKWLEIGVDVIGFHTDIGTQTSLMISPASFRKYIKPMFKEIFTLIRNAGTHVNLSSDGRLLEIVDDLVECGVSMHDPQFRANTIEGIKKTYKDKMCVNLDLDRQMFPFCKPEDIYAQVEEAKKELNYPKGGLMIQGSVFGTDVSLENIEAICAALEKFCF